MDGLKLKRDIVGSLKGANQIAEGELPLPNWTKLITARSERVRTVISC